MHQGQAKAGVGIDLPGPYETGRRGRDYRDVLVACPGKSIPTPAPPFN